MDFGGLERYQISLDPLERSPLLGYVECLGVALQFFFLDVMGFVFCTFLPYYEPILGSYIKSAVTLIH